MLPHPTTSFLAKFLRFVREHPDGGCWLYEGYRRRDGYAQAWWDGRQQYLHRAMYEHLVGPIPDGLTLDHLCRVRNCVNPSHLDPVSAAENTRRGIPRNSRKSVCPKGHEYDVQSSRARFCRKCRGETLSEYRARNRESIRERNREWMRRARAAARGVVK